MRECEHCHNFSFKKEWEVSVKKEKDSEYCYRTTYAKCPICGKSMIIYKDTLYFSEKEQLLDNIDINY